MGDLKRLSFDFVEVVDHDEIHEELMNDLYQYFVMKEQVHIHMEQDVLMIDLLLKEESNEILDVR
jgi:hypothetical protein